MSQPPVQDERYIFYSPPTCPSCGSERLLKYGNVKRGHPRLGQYVKCGKCGTRRILVPDVDESDDYFKNLETEDKAPVR